MQDPNLWTSNRKSHICDSCPHADTREGCLVAGLPDPLANLTFLLEKPQDGSVHRGLPLQDRDGRVFKHLFNDAVTLAGDSPPYQVLYAVGKPSRKAPPKSVVNVCGTYAEQKLAQYHQRFKARHPGDKKIHIIVTLGATASRTLMPGMKNLNKARGQAHSVHINGHEFFVVPTLGLSQINVKPGTSSLMVNDIARAIKLSRRSELPKPPAVSELTKDYILPTNEQELLDLTELILGYYDPEKRDSPDDWPIAVDTETNSLDPWRRDSKVLMVSFAWDDQQSAAICLHHPESPYPESVARECMARILASPKPKIFHNMKFDYQFLVHTEGFVVNNFWWDTLLGEHYLDEDTKGYYSLDAMCKPYCKQYSGYKAQIQESLIARVKSKMLEGIDQTGPDATKSYLLAPFFPDEDYQPVCEREDAQNLLDDDRITKLFDHELAYIEAHIAKNKKAKTSARGKLRRCCKKWGLTPSATIKRRDYAKEMDSNGYENVPIDVLLTYAATDTDVTRIICKKQLRRAANTGTLPQIKKLMRTVFVPGSVELGKMEFAGTPTDREYIHTSATEIRVVEEEMLTKLRTLVCKGDFNPNSDLQLADAVVSVLRFSADELETTDTGQVSVTKGWIEVMAEKYKEGIRGEFMQSLFLYRACTRALTFLDSFEKLSEHDGRIHTTFWLNGTKTGRLSSRGPNLQNVPYTMVDSFGYPGWNIKRPFSPVSPADCFWQMDISQAEIRVLCLYSKDAGLIEAVRGGLDTHSFITGKVFDIPYEEVYAKKDTDPEIKHKRTACKRVVFGTIYGAGKYKIAEQIYGNLSDDPHEKEMQVQFASDVMSTLMDRFPGIRRYTQHTHRQVDAQGYVETKFGRRRRFKLRNATGSHRYKAQRDAVNFKIQSTSSDIVLSQLIEANENMHQLGASTMQLTVHDSMGGVIPLNRVHAMKPFFDHYIVDRVAERFKWLPVPFDYDLEVGPSYGEPIDYSLVTTPQTAFTEKHHKQFSKLSETQLAFYHRMQEFSP